MTGDDLAGAWSAVDPKAGLAAKRRSSVQMQACARCKTRKRKERQGKANTCAKFGRGRRLSRPWPAEQAGPARANQQARLVATSPKSEPFVQNEHDLRRPDRCQVA